MNVVDPSMQKLFIKANSFSGLSYYLLSVRMNVTDDRWTEMQMVLETTEPPYGGYCRFDYNKSTNYQLIIGLSSEWDLG
jgi:hypothetical protein